MSNSYTITVSSLYSLNRYLNPENEALLAKAKHFPQRSIASWNTLSARYATVDQTNCVTCQA